MPRGGHDIPVSGTHLKGTHEVVTKGVDPTIKILHFASALFTKDMLRIVKGFAPWILFDCF